MAESPELLWYQHIFQEDGAISTVYFIVQDVVPSVANME